MELEHLHIYLLCQLVKLEGDIIDGAICTLNLGVPTHLDEASFNAGRVLDENHL